MCVRARVCARGFENAAYSKHPTVWHTPLRPASATHPTEAPGAQHANVCVHHDNLRCKVPVVGIDGDLLALLPEASPAQPPGQRYASCALLTTVRDLLHRRKMGARSNASSSQPRRHMSTRATLSATRIRCRALATTWSSFSTRSAPQRALHPESTEYRWVSVTWYIPFAPAVSMHHEIPPTHTLSPCTHPSHGQYISVGPTRRKYLGIGDV